MASKDNRWFQVSVKDAKALNEYFKALGLSVRRFAKGWVLSCRQWSDGQWLVWDGGHGTGDRFTTEQMQQFFSTVRNRKGAVVYETNSEALEARWYFNLNR
ncbi:MAG: hypothetical protein WC683_10210 [bacterium]